MTYLQVQDRLTHTGPQEPSLRDILNKGGREANQNNQKVSNGQIDDKNIGHGSHVVVAPHGKTNQSVAYEADDEGGEVKGNEEPLIRSGYNVLVDIVDILLLSLTVLVPAISDVNFVRARCVAGHRYWVT